MTHPALDRIAQQRVVPVLRSPTVVDAVATAHACAAAGLDVIELTTTTPGVEQALRELATDGLTVGLGTVRHEDHVRLAADAGATFVVSFFRPRAFVATAHNCGLAAIPGGSTPSELEAAQADGADAVKLYPANQASTQFVRDLHVLLPGLRVVVSGGIPPEAESIRPWLEAGAIAAALGSLGTVAGDGAGAVTARCRTATAALA
jgi:Entner-Doudoroff aldolase